MSPYMAKSPLEFLLILSPSSVIWGSHDSSPRPCSRAWVDRAKWLSHWPLSISLLFTLVPSPTFLPLTSFAVQIKPGSGFCDCGRTGCPTLNWRNKNLSLLGLGFHEPCLHLCSHLQGDLGKGGASVALLLLGEGSHCPRFLWLLLPPGSSNNFIKPWYTSRKAGADTTLESDYYLTPIRMATINNNKCWQECGEIQTLVHC